MQSPYLHVHLVGIGGIHVSAIAKLLLALGVKVSGSDLAENELLEELRQRGVQIAIGHAAEHVPSETEAIVFSSAANEENPERAEGRRRSLPAFNSHQFLGLLGEDEDMDQIIVTGTHGKSTTTAMIGVMAKATKRLIVAVVGTRVPQFSDGNLELSDTDGAFDFDYLIAEGDEFDHHFLAYRPRILVINNIEGDHFDVYPTVEAMLSAYRSLIERVVERGVIIANDDDPLVRRVLSEMNPFLKEHGIRIMLVGTEDDVDYQIGERRVENGKQIISLFTARGRVDLTLAIPGEMNARNAAMCFVVGDCMALSRGRIATGIEAFQGIWRRLEKIGEKNGITVFSDYGHHPTAVTKTLEAIKEFYPGRRIVLCFQPHHRNRTKHLFQEFVSCFGLADALVLSEIYDVKGRDQSEDETVSSRDLIRAVEAYNGEKKVQQTVSYASNPDEALSMLQRTLLPNDVLVVMGAGDIYKIAYALV
ncbi:UDP-N-acetylmuramate--L-alanine ligase [Patescibacteria group bacterium]|nr:UDP-N-acetylmuramate--L-alanine ligase [Patescibacteria group bacterium]